jgi:UTP--glucose-1-phosphate uridylyltransferase
MTRSTTRRPAKAVFPLSGLRPRTGDPAQAGRGAGRLELMTVVDRPLIQYAIEEALGAGFNELIFVSGPSHRGTGSDRAVDLEVALEMRGRTELLETIREFVPRHVNCVMVRQPEALGPAHAVLCARPVLGNEPFAVILAEELLSGADGGAADTLDDMAACYESYRCSIVAARPLGEDAEAAPTHGVLRCGAQLESLYQVAHVADRPRFGDDCTQLAVVGRYLFAPGALTHLDTLMRRVDSLSPGEEPRLLDAIALLLRHETVLACQIEGERFDCGTRLGYLKAMLAFGLAHPEVGPGLASHVAGLAANLGRTSRAATPPVQSDAGDSALTLPGMPTCVESSELSRSAT